MSSFASRNQPSSPIQFNAMSISSPTSSILSTYASSGSSSYNGLDLKTGEQLRSVLSIPDISANSYLKVFKPSDQFFGGVECRMDGATQLLGALACVRKGPATDDVVPADTEPILIYDSEILESPLFTLAVSLTISPLALFYSFLLVINRAFFLSSSYFFFLGSSGSTQIALPTCRPLGPSSMIGYRSAAFVGPLEPSFMRFPAVSVAIGLVKASSAFSQAFGYALGCSLCYFFCHISNSDLVLVCPVLNALSI